MFGSACSHIKNSFIIVIAVTARDEESEGKLYSLVGKNTKSVSKCIRRAGGDGCEEWVNEGR